MDKVRDRLRLEAYQEGYAEDKQQASLREIMQGITSLQASAHRVEDRLLRIEMNGKLEHLVATSNPIGQDTYSNGLETRNESADGYAILSPMRLPDSLTDPGRYSLGGASDEGPSVQNQTSFRPSSITSSVGGLSATHGRPHMRAKKQFSRQLSIRDMPSLSSRVKHRGSGIAMEPHFATTIGHTWPSCVAVREDLQGEIDKNHMDKIAHLIGVTTNADATGFNPKLSKKIQRPITIPMDPDTLPVLVVDMLRFIVLVMDIVLTPFVLAWDLRVEGSLTILAWMTASYWVLDCMVNFAIGFYRHGELVMSLVAIANHYFRTWFFVDITLLMADWTVIAVDSVGNEDSGLRLVASVARGLRVIKMLRLAKVVYVINTIVSRLLSRESGRRAHLLKIPMALVLYNHFVCCVWSLIGRLETYHGLSWLDNPVTTQDADGETLRDASVLTQYLKGLHWTIAQMTPGPIDIVAETNIERAFNCCILVIGALYGSMIVSQFSGHIMQITVMQREKMQTLDVVRVFLKQRQIRRALALRVQKQVHQRLFKENPLQPSDVQALKLLAKGLLEELSYELRLPPLLSHPLFRVWSAMDPVPVKALCNTGIDLILLAAQEQLFVAGGESHDAFVVMSGGMLYIQEPGLSFVPERQETAVEVGSWVCEAALWSYWTHVGHMEARMASELMVLTAHALMAELTRSTPGAIMLRHYGRGFHLRITTAVPPFSPWPTDLHVPFTEFSNLVSTRVGIGLLQNAIKHGIINLTDEAESNLVTELMEEKCCLKKEPEGGLVRMVSVVALRLRNENEELLMQVGRFEESKGTRAAPGLPGTKRGANEVLQIALQRLLDRRLPGVAGSMSLETVATEVLQRDSMAFGIPTIYQRTVHDAFLDGELDPAHWLEVRVDANCYNMECVYRVDDAKGFFLYAWVPSFVLEDLEKSEMMLNEFQGWLEQVTKDRREFLHVANMEV